MIRPTSRQATARTVPQSSPAESFACVTGDDRASTSARSTSTTLSPNSSGTPTPCVVALIPRSPRYLLTTESDLTWLRVPTPIDRKRARNRFSPACRTRLSAQCAVLKMIRIAQLIAAGQVAVPLAGQKPGSRVGPTLKPVPGGRLLPSWRFSTMPWPVRATAGSCRRTRASGSARPGHPRRRTRRALARPPLRGAAGARHQAHASR